MFSKIIIELTLHLLLMDEDFFYFGGAKVSKEKREEVSRAQRGRD
jgi:hypothetical protein